VSPELRRNVSSSNIKAEGCQEIDGKENSAAVQAKISALAPAFAHRLTLDEVASRTRIRAAEPSLL